jgi:hypothetical protein
MALEPAWLNLDRATFLECYSHKNLQNIHTKIDTLNRLDSEKAICKAL